MCIFRVKLYFCISILRTVKALIVFLLVICKAFFNPHFLIQMMLVLVFIIVFVTLTVCCCYEYEYKSFIKI